MIESIYQIGRALLEESGGGRRAVLESLAAAPPRDRKDESYVAILKLDSRRLSLDVELRELDSQKNTAARYLWLGNAPGNDPQDRLTLDNLGYLVSQTIPNLLGEGRIDPKSDLYSKLKNLREKLYIDLGEPGELGIKGGGTYQRNRRLWDLGRLGIPGPSREDLRDEIRGGTNPKNIPQRVVKALRDHFPEIPERGVLFTLELDGDLLVDDPAYHTYLERRFVDSAFTGNQTGRCHLSGEYGPVTTDMTRFRFKYYITDKLGFASGATKKGFTSNFALSKEAYRALLVGERFVGRELGFSFAGARGYMIPDLYTVEIPRGFPEALVRTLRSIRNRTLFDIGRVQAGELDEELEEFREEHLASGYMINLLFYKQKQAKFEVLRLIQDIPSYRLEELRAQGFETGRLWEELYGDEARDLTLQQIYYLIPVRKVRKPDGKVEYLNKKILAFYHTLISGGLIDRKELTDGFMELARAYRFGNTGSYQVSAPKEGMEDLTLVRYLAQTNLLLAFLRDLDQLKEEEVSQEYLERLSLDEVEKEYLKRLGYDEQQAALYLLGALVAEIANAQWRLGPEGRGGEKTILNKINYQGMTLPRVQRLATELFDKLRQYRYTDRSGERRPLLQGRNEAIFAQAQELLTRNQRGWRLTPSENVYYLLSGYSHRTFRAMTAREKQPA
ncbi:type I-B CRISPR-associated protein Cas8b/Csh1 [Rubrobacter calidifluminis]|uniref:type I-B CRISPR-associated protein Cas8b/Csh1 n=1 Tax=Rubrobacter calidifluminis TaxID=1392640 RepID=UPI0023619939|nr:type I-B CRISPR-associated protein Cas8b/Csh1 [Rubrobacter calidifluminis]